jgi:hypothetical protein
MNKYLDTFDKHIPFEEIFHGKVEENQDNTWA